MYNDEDWKLFVKYKNAENRHFRYGRSIRRYIRENRDLMEMSGWIDWAYEESRKPFVYEKQLPAWTETQWAEMSAVWEKNRLDKKS